MKEKRKKAKKDTGKEDIEEDDPVKLKHATYVMTCKLFADLERLKKEGELKQAEAKYVKRGKWVTGIRCLLRDVMKRRL